MAVKITRNDWKVCLRSYTGDCAGSGPKFSYFSDFSVATRLQCFSWASSSTGTWHKAQGENLFLKSLLNVLTCFVLCIQLVQEKKLLKAWFNCQINVMRAHVFYFLSLNLIVWCLPESEQLCRLQLWKAQTSVEERCHWKSSPCKADWLLIKYIQFLSQKPFFARFL